MSLVCCARHDQIILFRVHVNSEIGISRRPKSKSDWANVRMHLKRFSPSPPSDVNECSELNKRMVLCKNAQCINTVGSYQCVCLPGFTSERDNYCVETPSTERSAARPHWVCSCTAATRGRTGTPHRLWMTLSVFSTSCRTSRILFKPLKPVPVVMPHLDQRRPEATFGHCIIREGRCVTATVRKTTCYMCSTFMPAIKTVCDPTSKCHLWIYHTYIFLILQL